MPVLCGEQLACVHVHRRHYYRDGVLAHQEQGQATSETTCTVNIYTYIYICNNATALTRAVSLSLLTRRHKRKRELTCGADPVSEQHDGAPARAVQQQRRSPEPGNFNSRRQYKVHVTIC